MEEIPSAPVASTDFIFCSVMPPIATIGWTLCCLSAFSWSNPNAGSTSSLEFVGKTGPTAQTVDSGELMSLYNLLRGIAGVPHDQFASSLIKDRLNPFVFLSDVHTVYMYLKRQIDVVVNKVRDPMVLRSFLTAVSYSASEPQRTLWTPSHGTGRQ